MNITSHIFINMFENKHDSSQRCHENSDARFVQGCQIWAPKWLRLARNGTFPDWISVARGKLY